jgi:putative endonuclease
MLECADKSLYTGITNRLPERLKKHAQGKAARYTASRLPVRLIYCEEAPDKSAALKRERAIKNLTRAEKLRLTGAGEPARL